MTNKMERNLEMDLAKILKKESFQGKMISYMSKVGKLLLFILPLVLLIVTLLAFFFTQALYFTLKIN